MKTILLDMSCLAHSAMYRCNGNVLAEEADTAIATEILQRVLSLGERFKSNLFYFAFDGSKHANPRFAIYADYKAKRGVKRQEESLADAAMRQQMCKALENLMQILPDMGFGGVLFDNVHESDDHMARAALLRESVIVTTDGDLLQCISDKVTVFNPTTNKMTTEQSFMDQHGVHPSRWADVKTLAGCNSDEVPGVPGVGVDTALKYMRGELSITSKRYHSIETHKSILERNRKLVTLPYPSTPQVLPAATRVTRGTFTRACKEWGFDVFLLPDNLERWARLFRGEFTSGGRYGKGK
jgi:5'-3' exonuclease